MDIRINKVYIINKDRVKAVFSFVLGDNELALHDVLLINVNEKLFLAMPHKAVNGIQRDIVHPIGNSLREKMEALAIEEYKKILTMEE